MASGRCLPQGPGIHYSFGLITDSCHPSPRFLSHISLFLRPLLSSHHCALRSPSHPSGTYPIRASLSPALSSESRPYLIACCLPFFSVALLLHQSTDIYTHPCLRTSAPADPCAWSTCHASLSSFREPLRAPPGTRRLNKYTSLCITCVPIGNQLCR